MPLESMWFQIMLLAEMTSVSMHCLLHMSRDRICWRISDPTKKISSRIHVITTTLRNNSNHEVDRFV